MHPLARALLAGTTVLATAAGLARGATPPVYNTYWGDLHGHTMETPVTLTTGIIDGYIRYARDTKGLNFVALTEKDFDLSDSEWADCKARAAAFTTSSFLAFSAFEWGDDGYGDFGHRPVYYLTDNQPLLRSSVTASDHVSELLDLLQSTTNGFTGVAHPDLSNYLTDWDYFDGTVDRTAEIYSRHGHYETGDRGLQQALAQGYRFGFTAVSDSRTAQPGDYGLTAVLATSLTKSNLHAAIKARRVYATSGARILLRVQSDGHEVGEEYTASTGPTISVTCTPTAPLISIEILKNNAVAYTYAPVGGTPMTTSGGWRSGSGMETTAWVQPNFDDTSWPVTVLETEMEQVRKGSGTVQLRQRVQVAEPPPHAILRARLQGDYRVFLNGDLVVDTRTMIRDVRPEHHECGGPDGHDLVGTRECFRDLGFYDLGTLGVALHAGENVLALEYDAKANAAAPLDFGLEAVTQALPPVSFTWADNSFTGASFYYVRVTQTDGHQAWASPIWVDRVAPDTTPPQAPTKLRANKDGNNVYLSWPKVTKDETGSVETLSYYRVFRGTTPDFVPDRSGLSNQIGTSTKAHYSDTGALNAPSDYYYRVTSVDAAGNQSSGQSNQAFSVHHPLVFHAATSNIYWLSIPHQAIYNTADRLARDLNRSTSGPCTKLVHWNVSTQRPETWVFLGGSWMGTNFALVPGEAVAITIAQNFDAMLVGAHDNGSVVHLATNPGRPSLNWVSVPLVSPHQFAYQVVQDINGGYFPGPVTRITRLRPDLQVYQSYLWNGSSWSGTNFALLPGEAFGVEVQAPSDWVPDTLP